MHLFFYPIFDRYWFVAAVAVALLLVVVLVGPGRQRVSLGGRVILALVRCGVIALLVLGMLRPTLVYTETHKEKATLVLLIDQSRSMLVRDGLNNKTRWESLQAALKDSAGPLRDLGRDFEIKAYTFDAETHALGEVKDGTVVLPDSPAGQQTAIGAALEDVLNQENGKRLLGIVILTDGRQQVPSSDDLAGQRAPEYRVPRRRNAAPQDVAAKLRRQNFPVFPVVFGQSRGLGGVQDVAVVDFPTPDTVFVNTEMVVHGEIKINGYVNQPIPVRLLMETPDGKMEVIGKTEVKAAANGDLLPVDFTHEPKTPGEFMLTLEAVPQPGELVITNNQLTSFVHVRKGGLNVLYIEGELRVEQKFLRRALDSWQDIKVDFIRLDPRHLKETKPGNLKDLFAPGKYDVYILGDVDATAFSDEELKQLNQTVNGGKGLIMLGGFHTYGPGGYFGTSLEDVLPVDMDRLERQPLDGPIREDMQIPGPLQMQPTPRSMHHFVLGLATAQENAAAWAKLPPLEGANRFSVAKKRGATILAEADDKDHSPLLVSHEWGGGRVIAFAGDSTWRWVMRGFESAHKRFWRQLVLWLARKDQMDQGDVWVRLDNTRFFPGNHVEFTAGAQSPQNEPIADADFQVEFVKPDKKRTTAVVDRKEDHAAGSFHETQQPGVYAIEVTATRPGVPGAPGKLLGTARTRFIVLQQDLELDSASADLDAMKGVAKSSGGEVVEAERLPGWLTELMKRTDYLDIKQETKKTLWDRWPFLVAVVLLLTVEWILRKAWGLV